MYCSWDPNELNIVAGASGTGSDDGEIADGTPGPADGVFDFGDGNEPSNLTAAKLVEVLEDTNVQLNANTQIDVEVAVDASGAAGNQTLGLDAPTINFSDGANITLNDATLTIGSTQAGNVVLLEGATVTLSTGAGEGNIEIAGTVNGTGGGVAEALVLDAGTGNITLSSAVGSGAADELTTVTITDAEVVQTNAFNITGALTTTNALTGAFTSAGTLTVGSLDMDGHRL